MQLGLPWWLSGKESPANAGDMGSSPDLGRSLLPMGNEATHTHTHTKKKKKKKKKSINGF